MALGKSDAEQAGLRFYKEGEARPEDPDQEIWEADMTVDGHTLTFVGKSEEEVLAQAESAMIASGRIKPDSGGAGGGEPTIAQESDVADLEAYRSNSEEVEPGQQQENAEEVAKQDDDAA